MKKPFTERNRAHVVRYTRRTVSRGVLKAALAHLKSHPSGVPSEGCACWLCLAEPASGHSLSKVRRVRILELGGWKCARCASEIDLTIDHRVAVVNGGSNADSNLEVLCWPCNLKKKDG